MEFTIFFFLYDNYSLTNLIFQAIFKQIVSIVSSVKRGPWKFNDKLNPKTLTIPSKSRFLIENRINGRGISKKTCFDKFISFFFFVRSELFNVRRRKKIFFSFFFLMTKTLGISLRRFL